MCEKCAMCSIVLHYIFRLLCWGELWDNASNNICSAISGQSKGRYYITKRISVRCSVKLNWKKLFILTLKFNLIVEVYLESIIVLLSTLWLCLPHCQLTFWYINFDEIIFIKKKGIWCIFYDPRFRVNKRLTYYIRFHQSYLNNHTRFL